MFIQWEYDLLSVVDKNLSILQGQNYDLMRPKQKEIIREEKGNISSTGKLSLDVSQSCLPPASGKELWNNFGTGSLALLCIGNYPNPSSKFLAHLKRSCFTSDFAKIVWFLQWICLAIIIEGGWNTDDNLDSFLGGSRHNSNMHEECSRLYQESAILAEFSSLPAFVKIELLRSLKPVFSKFSPQENPLWKFIKADCWVQPQGFLIQ